MTDYSRSIAEVRQRIAAACRRAARDPSEVQLVAVTKYLPVGELEGLASQGITDVGEHRVLESLERRTQVRAGYRWHMIGHVQTNKVKKLLEWADVLHSVDRLELAVALEKELVKRGRRLPAYVQVNVSGETTKGGFGPADAEAAVLEIRRSAPHLELLGLMTMAPEGTDARPHFRRLRELAGRCAVPGLSMGMSQDYEAAIEEGATCVRVGTALFSRQ
jgi:PLP dependent protein